LAIFAAQVRVLQIVGQLGHHFVHGYSKFIEIQLTVVVRVGQPGR
jgi:hypothetical protein